MKDQLLPTLTCIDTMPAFTLIHQIDDADFPERAAYARALLARTVTDLRSTADHIEKRLTGEYDGDDGDDDGIPNTELEQTFRVYFKGSPTKRQQRLLKQLSEEHSYYVKARKTEKAR